MTRRLSAIVVVLISALLFGGGIVYYGGANVGSASFPLLAPDGVVGTPPYSFASETTLGFFRVSASQIQLAGGSLKIDTPAHLYLTSDGTIGNPAVWRSANQGMYFGTGYTALIGSANGIVLDGSNNQILLGFTAGNVTLKSAVSGVLQFQGNTDYNSNWATGQAGEVSLNGNYTNATASFTATNLSVTVVSGQTYRIQAVIFLSDSTAADGAQINFNGGGAAATNFRMHCVLDDTTTTVQDSSQVTALATAFAKAVLSGTGAHEWACNGTFVPSGNGTFIIQAAQNSHSSGTLTVQRGSWLSVVNSRPL